MCETLRLDAVRRVEVVPVIGHFEFEIREDGGSRSAICPNWSWLLSAPSA
jgi:hypothetical protein